MYAVVIEFQKRGAIHYHAIIFNIPYVHAPTIGKIWNVGCKGSVHIEKIDDMHDVGSYVCKYMTKSSDDPRLCGQKAYFTSKNLEKPKTVLYFMLVNVLRNTFFGDKEKTFESNFENKYCGKGTYTLYNLTHDQELKKQALAFLRL